MKKSTANRPSKLERVLSHLAAGNSLNRFEAEYRVNDHCLHSTMSALKHRFGICYSKRTEVVPGYEDAPTTVARYWLEEPEFCKANATLQQLRQKRGIRGGS